MVVRDAASHAPTAGARQATLAQTAPRFISSAGAPARHRPRRCGEPVGSLRCRPLLPSANGKNHYFLWAYKHVPDRVLQIANGSWPPLPPEPGFVLHFGNEWPAGALEQRCFGFAKNSFLFIQIIYM